MRAITVVTALLLAITTLAPGADDLAPTSPTTGIKAESTPFWVRRDGHVGRLVNVRVEGGPLFHGVDVEAEVQGRTITQSIPPAPLGRQAFELVLPVDDREKPLPVKLTLETAGGTHTTAFELPPQRKWTVHLLHHTHLDIGYTHSQEDVMALQHAHLERALELVHDSRRNPPAARFKWLPEGLWAVDDYLNRLKQENTWSSRRRLRRFVAAVENDSVGLDALYGNALTALHRPEELFELLDCSRRLSQTHGFEFDSAMITDVPGYTWGLIPALSHYGVKYLSIGPNSGHRIGHTRAAWSDRPFYWVSPSGRERVLCWMAGKGYSWFHTGLNYDKITKTIDAQPILGYLQELERSDFPYDMVQVRYNIGSDNGPPDPGLAAFVKEWNEKYAWPRMVIATTSQAFREFEARWGKAVPEHRGDFTPYWEDGAASTAYETALNRAAAERLVQAATLWSILRPGDYPRAHFEAAWREAILYDEHTWGAWNSISDPDSEFVKVQWAWKGQRAVNADRMSRQLLNAALSERHPQDDAVEAVEAVETVEAVEAVDVFNTSSWPRTDLMILSAAAPRPGDVVKDAEGIVTPSQRLRTGELAFLARDVPPLGAKRFTLHAGAARATGAAYARGATLGNEFLTLEVEAKRGAIASFKRAGTKVNLVDGEAGLGLNDYVYIAGKDPRKDSKRVEGAVKIRVKEPGPLLAALEVISNAPGCEKLVRELSVVAGLDRVDLDNTLYKTAVREKEGVHFAFPLHVLGGVVRLDTPWAVVRPDADLLDGACRNYFTVQRWVDVSSEYRGVTWAVVDAPLVEIGRIGSDANVVGWFKETPPSTTLYSYVMNNYWETNYKADQAGKTTFRYSLRPHTGYDAVAAQRFGRERSQPLLVARAAPDAPPIPSFMRFKTDSVVVTSLKPSADGRAWIARLFNIADRPVRLLLGGESWRASLSSPYEESGRTFSLPFELPPSGIATIRCERK